MSTLTTGTYEKYGASYKTLTLTDGEYAFTVTPEKGGMATSFTKNGDEYLWLRDKNFESTDRPRCGIPILFPNCGKPDDGVHHFFTSYEKQQAFIATQEIYKNGSNG